MNTNPFECPVCFEYYDTLGHVPTTFTCGHSCCISHGAKLKNCPLCRIPISRNLAPNIALRDGAIEYQKVMKFKNSETNQKSPPSTKSTLLQSVQTPSSSISNGFQKLKSYEAQSPVLNTVTSLPLEGLQIQEKLNVFTTPTPPNRRFMKVISHSNRFQRNLHPTDDITLNFQDLKLGQNLSFSMNSPITPLWPKNEAMNDSKVWGSEFLTSGGPLFNLGSHTDLKATSKVQRRERKKQRRRSLLRHCI